MKTVSKVIDIFIGVILIMFAFMCVYPLYYVLINSLSKTENVLRGVYFFPIGFTLENYKEIFKIPLVFTGILISTSRAVVGTILTTFCSSLLGFLFTQKDLPVKKTLYRFVIVTMYLSSGLIPWYMLMKTLHLKNSFFLYILPVAVSGFYVILIKTYIESIPVSLQESASLDGAGVLTIYAKIIIPVSLPILACIAVFSSVNQWNAWIDNMFLVSDKRLQTMQYLLYRMLQSQSMSEAITGNTRIQPMSLRLTMTFVTVFPILLVYPFMQRYFVKGLMLGAIKG